MIVKFIRYLIQIKNRQRIAPVPRMLASGYSRLTDDEARVMARYGIRSPSGLKLAMKKYGVTTIDALVEQLEHYRPKRRIIFRIKQMLIRVSGGVPYHPYAKQIKEIDKKTGINKELELRLKRWRA